MAILVSKKVTKRFGGLEAVSKVDLEIKEHAIYSIIGPNGAGKTTLFNCVTGFYTPEEGEIIFNGRNITGLSPDRVTRLGISRHLAQNSVRAAHRQVRKPRRLGLQSIP